MTESLKRAIHQALLRLLVPIAHLLLESGVGIGEFLSIAKIAYVRAAIGQVKDTPGAMLRPNATRIAVVTGLTRKDVATILSAPETGLGASNRGRQRAERVLTGWWNDPDFQDDFGRPAILSEQGSKASFEQLCGRYSGDARFAAILEELVRVGAVRKSGDGRLAAVSRTYATVGWDPEGVLELGRELADHCQTLLHNLKHPTRPRVTRRICNMHLDPRYAPMLLRDLEQQVATFADSVDDALNADQYTLRPGKDGQAVRVGLGIYVFEGEGPADSAHSDQRQAPGKKGKKKSRGGRV